MKKTPDELKKGLGWCANDAFLCRENCPYFNQSSNGVDCALELHTDALVYIQQLEAKAGLVDQYRWERDVAIDQLEQLGIGFGEKVESKVPKWISVEERLPEPPEED